MAVRAQCPRCKQPLSVPNKLAGSYANCPRCQGRFWVSKDAPIDPSVNDMVGSPSASTLTLTQAPIAGPPLAAPPGAAPAGRPLSSSAWPASGAAAPAGPAAPPPAPPRQYFPSVTPQVTVAPLTPLPAALAPAATVSVNDAPSGVPAAPPQARKVARFVTAEAAQSTLKLAADGQLPHLQLQESDKKDKDQRKSRSIPPLVMIAAWGFSVALTVVMVMFLGDDGSSSVTTQAKTDAMAKIEEQFFGNPARAELLPYQRSLRAARQARARGDFKAERQCYKQVLDLLHTETWGGATSAALRTRLEKGVTGSRDHDRELEQLILTVMGD
jgi:hypothetical protein